MAAATNHRRRQSATASSATKITGSAAWPSAKPIAPTDSARPRLAANQRAIATMAIWLVIPWPKKRSPKTTRIRLTALPTSAIATQLNASPPRMKGASARTRKRSVRVPAKTIASAEAVVASV